VILFNAPRRWHLGDLVRSVGITRRADAVLQLRQHRGERATKPNQFVDLYPNEAGRRRLATAQIETLSYPCQRPANPVFQQVTPGAEQTNADPVTPQRPRSPESIQSFDPSALQAT
jgi:hypothetical protein